MTLETSHTGVVELDVVSSDIYIVDSMVNVSLEANRVDPDTLFVYTFYGRGHFSRQQKIFL